jgi:hypothetical protein
MRRRLHLALVGLLLVALAGCIQPPSDGAPESPGVPVLGTSRLTAPQLVAYYNSRGHPAYRAQDVTIEDLAQMFVDEGDRYHVRGDIAFAQSIIETGWFNYPDCDGCLLHPDSHNYAGIGACDTCGNGHGFSTPLAGVRAQMQLLRNMADAGSRTGTIPDPPVAELWGLDPAAATASFNHYFFKGRAPLWNDMPGVWASSPAYATTVLGVYNDMLSFGGLLGQCPADGLKFGADAADTRCPLDLRQPGRATANVSFRGYYVLNGDGKVSAYGGAPDYGSPSFDSDWGRDIAPMPDGNGYAVLSADGHVYRFGSAAADDALGALGEPDWEPGVDVARSLAITPDGKGFVILKANGEIYKAGTAATGPLGALDAPASMIDGRAIAIMPDGLGYVVLDSWGWVWKYGSATTGFVGAASTPWWVWSDSARDIVIPAWNGVGFGYYVLDSWGQVWSGGIVAPATNPRPTTFSDRFRGMGYRDGRIFVLRDDGSTITTS